MGLWPGSSSQELQGALCSFTSNKGQSVMLGSHLLKAQGDVGGVGSGRQVSTGTHPNE
jgi:hypothetical protein